MRFAALSASYRLGGSNALYRFTVTTVRRTLGGLDEKRLRLVLGLFFLALALPTALLVHKAYGQLKWESFHQLQSLAEELAGRIDRQLVALIEREEARSFADYGFLVVEGDLDASFLQRSPLSELPQRSSIPGLLGYFQIDADGAFSTPLLPDLPGTAATYGIPVTEREQRTALAQDLLNILARNRLLDARTRDNGALAEADDSDDMPGKLQLGRIGLEQTLPLESNALSAQAETLEHKVKASARPAFRSAEKRNLAQSGFDRLDLAEEIPAAAPKKARAKRLENEDALGLDLRYQRKAEDSKRQAAPALKDLVTKERSQRRERSLLAEPLYPADTEASLAEGEAEALEQSAMAPTPSVPQTMTLPPAATSDEWVPALGNVSTSSRQTGVQGPPKVKIRMFEGELDPFDLSLLESGHFVLYRKVWRDGRRYIQGALIAQNAFIRSLMEDAYRATALSRTSDLAVAYRGDLLSIFNAQPSRDYLSSTRALSGDLLYRGRLSDPAGDLELIFSVSQLPAGPGAWVVGWLATILGLVLAGGVYLLNRLGLRQIALTCQQQDFVSSVSHELKTPLTSIRMYGEMLREGWTTEERKQTYYDFICTESERLSRLINNVLQLARLTRNELNVDFKPVAIGALMGDLAPKLASQVETAGFGLRIDCAEAEAAVVRVDEDFLTQILINLVDNAVKFSREAMRREILIGCRLERGKELCLSVRDFGPGIPRDQMKKIFRLFYRSGSALTRETMGTGIGLALVRQLVLAMHGRVDAINADPGAELRVFLPVEEPTQ